MPVSGAPSPQLLHRHEGGDRVPDDTPAGRRCGRATALALRSLPSRFFCGGEGEHRVHGALAVLHQLRNEVRGEEGLRQHLLDEREPQQIPGPLVVLLQDLRQPCRGQGRFD